jgi:hypothetical protein
VFKTCHDAANTEAEGKIKERRRSGKINTAAHEVYGPGNQLNVDAEGELGDGMGAASNANLKIALQALAFQLGAWDIVMAHLSRNGSRPYPTCIHGAHVKTSPRLHGDS